MKMTAILCFVIGIILSLTGCSTGHGRLWEPPSRSSMWRRGYNTTVNSDDNELSCGGFENQWITFGGLCGVCGDPFQQHPRDNELGGKYASGIITREYPIGSIIDVIIGLTANHGGYFEFRLCPLTDSFTTESQMCMDQYKLQFVRGNSRVDKYHITDPTMQGEVRMKVQLPPDLSCAQCVLQWRYRTGTRWGCDADRKCGKGYGPQEEFYGCSDIAISNVQSAVFYDPDTVVEPDIGSKGLNDLGSKSQKEMSITPDVNRLPVTSKIIAEKLSSTREPQTTLSGTGNRHILKSLPLSFSFFNLEQLVLDALRRYYENRGRIVALGTTSCFANRKYLRNPIIQEFCMRMCSKNGNKCPPSMCTCKEKTDTTSKDPLTWYFTTVVPKNFQNVTQGVKGPFVTREMLNDELHHARNETDKKEGRGLDTVKQQIITGVQKNWLNEQVGKKLRNETDSTNETLKIDKSLQKQQIISKYIPSYVQHSDNNQSNDTVNVVVRPATVFVPRAYITKTEYFTTKSSFKPSLSTAPPTRRFLADFPVMEEIHQSPVRRRKLITRIPDLKDPFAHTNILLSAEPDIENKRSTSAVRHVTETTQMSETTSESPMVTKRFVTFSVNKVRCTASEGFSHNPFMKNWCIKNCSSGFCPSSVCACT